MEKYYCISFEGIDKSGKGQILKYVDYLANHKYVLMDRGIMSNITYAKLYNRSYEYDISQFKTWTFVYLVCDEEDWKIRCRLTNEPDIDYVKNLEAFEETRKQFELAGMDIMFINTSRISQYDAAKRIVSYMQQKNIC